MPRHFHPFRAPPHATSSSSKRTPHRPLQPLPSRKAATKFIRDVSFGIRAMSKQQLTIAALTFALVLFFCYLSTVTQHPAPHRTSHPLRTTNCACPLPATTDVFVDHILSSAGFVAKVTITSSVSNFLVLRIVQLYRGHIRSVQWPLLLPQRESAACYVEPMDHDLTSPTIQWLLVAGGIDSPSHQIASALSSSSIYNNFSILLPGTLKAPQCELLHSKSTDRQSRSGIVWMTPWHGLSAAVAENVVRDFGNEPLWWRTNDATLEFRDAVIRAVDASDPINSTVVSDPSVGHVTTSGAREWWLRDGVSVIAACKDRTSTLQQAVLTWLSADGVDEIVVVDWSSNPPIRSALNQEVLNDPRLVLVRADDQSQWILSRAYNLAARSASFSRLMKVDCDTVLTSGFFAAHDLKRDRFFAGDWRQLDAGATNALHTNGLLYVNRDDFLAIGGFDERITTYGWDDSDLAERLSKVRKPRTIVHDNVQHISHSASLRVTNQPRNSLLPPSNPFAAAVEIQRNRLLLTKYNLPIWRASSSHMVWNVRPDEEHFAEQFEPGENPQGAPVFITVKEASDVTAASALVSDADAEEVGKRAIRLILRRLGLPLLPKTLTFDFYKTLIAKVANPDKYAEVVLSLRGGCISKLLGHISSKEATTPGSLNRDSYVPPPYPYTGWRLEELWLSSDTDCSCSFSSIFDATEEEVLSEWLDNGNPIETTLSGPAVPNIGQSVTDVLRSFPTASSVKNVSVDVAKWYQTFSSSRMLIAGTSCSGDPVRLSSAERKRLRSRLAGLVPSKGILKGIRDSLGTKSLTILDSPLVDIQRQSNLVSGFRAHWIQESLTSADLKAMLSKWSSNSISTEAFLSHQLKQRAHAVMFSAYLAENGWDKSRISGSDLSELETIIAKVSRTFESLFQGCPASASDYIEAYPQLAIIIAGFFSAQLCL